MIRRCVLIALVSLTLVGVGAGTGAAATAYPTRVQVSVGEYWLTLSRLRVPAGRVKVEIVNYGEDPHDLKLKRIGGTHTYSISETPSGGRQVRTWRLSPGRFHVWCAASDHRAKGMHAILSRPRPLTGARALTSEPAAFSASSANTSPSGAVRYDGFFRWTRRK